MQTKKGERATMARAIVIACATSARLCKPRPSGALRFVAVTDPELRPEMYSFPVPWRRRFCRQDNAGGSRRVAPGRRHAAATQPRRCYCESCCVRRGTVGTANVVFVSRGYAMDARRIRAAVTSLLNACYDSDDAVARLYAELELLRASGEWSRLELAQLQSMALQTVKMIDDSRNGA
jgi:hypothetical protein